MLTLGEKAFKAIYLAQIADELKLKLMKRYSTLRADLVEPNKYLYSLLSHFMEHPNEDYVRGTLNFLVEFQERRGKGTAILFNEGIFALILRNTQFPVIYLRFGREMLLRLIARDFFSCLAL
eukprot:TRINITY_DN1487_c0_g2_i1.p2 TRINITY_DN1487_c0_g2~~TRINITY_DN1487_c0_g2_i1.p2  ORF type:complete len:122 (+),score=18.21 TRINITY_DN1487_c0_g2_i1:347-712(+)